MSKLLKTLFIAIAIIPIAILTACGNKTHKHTWDNWVVTIPPTCVAQGEETRTCKKDAEHKETRPADIDTSAHNYVGSACILCSKLISLSDLFVKMLYNEVNFSATYVGGFHFGGPEDMETYVINVDGVYSSDFEYGSAKGNFMRSNPDGTTDTWEISEDKILVHTKTEPFYQGDYVINAFFDKGTARLYFFNFDGSSFQPLDPSKNYALVDASDPAKHIYRMKGLSGGDFKEIQITAEGIKFITSDSSNFAPYSHEITLTFGTAPDLSSQVPVCGNLCIYCN